MSKPITTLVLCAPRFQNSTHPHEALLGSRGWTQAALSLRYYEAPPYEPCLRASYLSLLDPRHSMLAFCGHVGPPVTGDLPRPRGSPPLVDGFPWPRGSPPLVGGFLWPRVIAPC